MGNYVEGGRPFVALGGLNNTASGILGSCVAGGGNNTARANGWLVGGDQTTILDPNQCHHFAGKVTSNQRSIETSLFGW